MNQNARSKRTPSHHSRKWLSRSMWLDQMPNGDPAVAKLARSSTTVGSQLAPRLKAGRICLATGRMLRVHDGGVKGRPWKKFAPPACPHRRG
jgi:hypothetical protein